MKFLLPLLVALIPSLAYANSYVCLMNHTQRALGFKLTHEGGAELAILLRERDDYCEPLGAERGPMILELSDHQSPSCPAQIVRDGDWVAITEGEGGEVVCRRQGGARKGVMSAVPKAAMKGMETENYVINVINVEFVNDMGDHLEVRAGWMNAVWMRDTSFYLLKGERRMVPIEVDTSQVSPFATFEFEGLGRRGRQDSVEIHFSGTELSSCTVRTKTRLNFECSTNSAYFARVRLTNPLGKDNPTQIPISLREAASRCTLYDCGNNSSCPYRPTDPLGCYGPIEGRNLCCWTSPF